MRAVLKDIGVVIVAAAICCQFYEPTRVLGASMDPTLGSNDYLIVAREAFAHRAPQRGDVIVLQSTLKDPSGEEELLIKRIIGLPGEKLEIHSGKVFINGIPQDDSYTRDAFTSGDLSITIPEGEYFCMGDNRLHSTDSRDISVGCVKREEIRGKAIFRFFPFNKIGMIKDKI